MKISIEDDQLNLELSVGEKLCCCRRTLSVPLGSVRGMTEGVPEPRLLEVRVPGTHIPGVIKAGTFWTREGKEFWYVTPGKSEYVTLELDETAPFRRIVLGLDGDNRTVLSQLKVPEMA
ncbi:MAG: hypothetical protein ABIJ46_04135 [bacterium]